jgi:CRISPR-associated protein Cas8b1/Cst1 subtype I-B
MSPSNSQFEKLTVTSFKAKHFYLSERPFFNFFTLKTDFRIERLKIYYNALAKIMLEIFTNNARFIAFFKTSVNISGPYFTKMNFLCIHSQPSHTDAIVYSIHVHICNVCAY